MKKIVVVLCFVLCLAVLVKSPSDKLQAFSWLYLLFEVIFDNNQIVIGRDAVPFLPFRFRQ